MRQQDILTFKAVLLYILKNSPEDKRDVYCVVKTAYYAQQFHLAEWGCPMYRDTISALPFGPVPSTLYNILKVARGETRGILSRYGELRGDVAAAAGAIGFSDESFFAKEDPDMTRLSRLGVECLDKAIAKVDGMNFNEIMWDTHSGGEWRRAFDSPDKRMDPIGIARDGGADEGVLEYLADSLEWDSMLA